MEIKLDKSETILLKGKTASLAIDPEGVTSLAVDAVLFSLLPIPSASAREDEVGKKRDGEGRFGVEISGPGEYEVKGVQILGTGRPAVNYRVKLDGIKIAYVCQKISEREEEALSDIDILILAPQAQGEQKLSDLLLKLEPKIVVVYKTPDPEKFLKDIGKEGIVPSLRLVVKQDTLPEELEAVWLKP